MVGAPKGTRSWNTGTGKGWTDRRGYRWIRIGGRSVREHRAVMEQSIGRKLLPTEIVHHLNGDKTDNRLENLEVMHGGDHMRLHHKGEERSDQAKKRMTRAARDRAAIHSLAKRLAAADAINAELYEALELADLLLSGSNMNKNVVERKVLAALAKARGEA